VSMPRTPSQTVGPFLAIGLAWEDAPFVVPEGTSGAIWITGRVIDGAGEGVPDGLVETWQAAPDGRFADAASAGGDAPGAFRGFGRCATGPDGEYAILTLKPGFVPAADGSMQAPHADVAVFARGLLKQVVTRLYFADEAGANTADPLLALVDPDRRTTLIAEPTDDGYRFDVRLQGDRETVFFDI
jgi:protocatechuate 3,4-dioxygenase alpha subunit